MREIAISEFRRLDKAGLQAVKPAIIAFDGSPIGVFCSIDGVIVVEDLHPRVKNLLQAQEKRARIGMPKTEKVIASDVMPSVA